MLTLVKILPWILLLFLFGTWTPWRSIFNYIFGNNPYRAKIYVEAGEQIEICKGRFDYDSPKGTVYKYKYCGVKSSVIVPLKYPYRYILGCRQIRVIAGSPTAAPLGGMASSSIQVTASGLNMVLEAHIGRDLAKSIFGKAVSVMTVFIILAVLVIAGYFMYQQIQPGGAFAPEPAQTAPAQTAPAQTAPAVPKPGPLE